MFLKKSVLLKKLLVSPIELIKVGHDENGGSISFHHELQDVGDYMVGIGVIGQDAFIALKNLTNTGSILLTADNLSSRIISQSSVSPMFAAMSSRVDSSGFTVASKDSNVNASVSIIEGIPIVSVGAGEGKGRADLRLKKRRWRYFNSGQIWSKQT